MARFRLFCREWALILIFLVACREISETAAPSDLTATPSDLPVTPPEVQIEQLPLQGEIAQNEAEYSGLAWYADFLILLPQYPSRFDHHLWAIPKSEILAFLDGELAALHPQQIPLIDAEAIDGLRGFEGYEAIAFDGNIAYLTIESDAGSEMVCYVVRGQMLPDLSALTLDAKRQEIPHPIEIDNTCVEALLMQDGGALTFFEANGANINPQPVAHQFGAGLDTPAVVKIPNIEYRLTDVTALDVLGRFWAINYMYPGDAGKLNPAADSLAAQFGTGESHEGSEIVERLVEFEWTEDGILLTETAPIWLALTDEARNWEGIVRLDERGFLIVTDKFPQTILAFVPYP